MRPHRLVVTAFGPFAGTETVDFDGLADGGPFLLHGPTGAGKTSLLDAIGFALFGEVPGARGAKQLRSHHAPPDRRTQVSLVATVGGRAVEIVRRPLQERPGRGGTVTDNPAVTVRIAADLSALDADDCLSRLSGVQEANTELVRLVGMGHRQFTQVAILPQGEFATFLRAHDDDRAAVLRQLFDVSVFDRLREELVLRAHACRDALTDAAALAERRSTQVATAAGVVDADVPTTARVPWAAALLATASADAEHADILATTARHAEGAARQALSDVTDLVRRQQARVRVQLDLDHLTGAAAPLDRLRLRLVSADRAAEVIGLLDVAAKADRRAAEVRERADAALLAAGHDLACRPSTDGLRQVRDEQAGTIAGLRGLLPVVERAERLRDLATLARRQVAALDADLTLLRDELAAAPDRLAELLTAVGAAEQAERDLVDVEGSLARLSQAVAAAETLVHALGAVHHAEVDELAARAASRHAESSLDALRRRRLAEVAGELAAGLIAGDPCVVCGAVEHPAPAALGQDAVDDQAEQRAAADADAARRTAVQATAALAAAEARRDVALSRLADGGTAGLVTSPVLEDAPGSTPAARHVRGALAREHEQLMTAASTLGPLARRRVELVDAVAAQRTADARVVDEVSRAAQQRAGHLAEADGFEEQVVHATALLTEAVGRDTDVVAALERAEAGHALTEQALAAELDVAGRELHAAETAALAQVGWTDRGFSTADEVFAAAQDQGWRDRTRGEVRDHDERVHGVRARLADRDLDVPTDPLADPAPATAALAAAVTTREAAERALAHFVGVRDRLAAAVPELEHAERLLEPLARSASAARDLADLAAGAGANRLRMPLSTYVLAAYLEQVVSAANERLSRMTDGRYTLAHVTTTSDRRRRGGLGLAVLDGWTGRERPAGTLSGGETFLASLALALGLSDVVTAAAGGVTVGALFIDEGFGTLDSEALDLAMDTLDGLRAHGRLVGVVSHVDELRHRLPRQLHVRRGDRGGSTVVVRDTAEAE